MVKILSKLQKRIGQERMKKFFFVPLFKVEKIENELSCLEEKGWRLDRISFFNCFHFVESSPKKASYFFTYKLIKENGMADVEHYLKSKLGANPVNGELDVFFHTTYVYRMVADPDLEKPRLYRNLYFQHLVSQQILFGLIMPIISVCCFLMQLITTGWESVDTRSWVIIGLMNVIPLCYCVYEFWNLCRLKKQYKKMLPHISFPYDDFLS